MLKKHFTSFIIGLSIFLMLLFLSAPFVQATIAKTYTNDAGDASYTPSLETTKDLYGLHYTSSQGLTEDGGNQNISIFTMKTDGVTSKLVTWAGTMGNDQYTRMSLSALAANYETNHPGWKVLAGINADQYFQKYGTALVTDGSDKYIPAPYYPLIIDGETRFGITATATTTSFVGFTNDGSTNGLVSAETPSGYILELLEGTKVVGTYPVDAINSPSSGTSIYAPVYDGGSGLTITKDLSGETYYTVERAELSYLSNSVDYASFKDTWAQNAFFGRGAISRIADSVSLSNGSFAVTTNNSALKESLKIGTRIRVMLTYSGEMASVEAASGYHTVQKVNNIEQDAANTYNSRSYPRSVFGQTADGTYFLMASDGHASGSTNIVGGKEIQGLNWKQIDAVLNEFAVVEAYQDDGGGSVTAVVRNDKGGFDCVNSPAEGSERSILSGLFFVMKDYAYEASLKSLSQNEATIAITSADPADLLYANLDGHKILVENGVVTFTGLSSNTLYTIHFSYVLNDEEREVIKTFSFKTYKQKPADLSFTMTSDGAHITVSWSGTDPDSAIQYVYVRLNSSHVNLTAEKPTVTIPLAKLKGSLWYCDATFSIAIGDGIIQSLVIPASVCAYIAFMIETQDAVANEVLK